jgi:hypothetical protein
MLQMDPTCYNSKQTQTQVSATAAVVVTECEPAAPVTTNLTYCVGDTAAAITTRNRNNLGIV